MAEEIEIVVALDDDHEELISEINIDGKFVGLISQDSKGIFFYEGPDPKALENSVSRKVCLTTFTKALDLARERLSD